MTTATATCLFDNIIELPPLTQEGGKSNEWYPTLYCDIMNGINVQLKERDTIMGQRGPQAISVEKRFWQKVAKASKDECWLWQACTYKHGYGKFALSRCNPVYAHRLAYELTYGSIPEDACVLHRCDVRACCNPNHLFLGTQLENIADMNAKGRGSKPPRTTPKEEHKGWIDASILCSLYATGRYKQKELGRMFGISQSKVSEIVRCTNVHSL